MGKTLDALLGRSFKASKFKTLVNLAISRLSVLKNQKRARCSIARSDVIQLLQISEHERALIRVEQVIKEQNMLDVFSMIESYCILLSERVKLIEDEKTCPEELQEAISSLIFAASRCGELPELQEIRYIFSSRYGKEFTLRATELRNRCGVNLKIIQKLSTRQPSLESRMKLLKEIADENGIKLQLEEAPSTAAEVNKEEDNRSAKNQSATSGVNFGDDRKDYPEEMCRVGDLSLSLNRGKQYKDVAEAAQEAFMSAAYAASAARAAVDLSRSTSGGPPDDLNHPSNKQRNQVMDSNSEVKSRTVDSQKSYSQELKDSVLRHEEVHPFDSYSLSSDEEEICQSDEMINVKQVDPISISSGRAEQNLKFNETMNEDVVKSETYSVGNKDEQEKRETKLLYYSPKQTATNIQANSRKESEEHISAGMAVKSSQRLNTVKRPVSVRTRR
ncbi:uncharacterized protein LOC110719615 [Chenopodium quinoa]|nr:uncharacterized protein LOC110719615 [Chenopodium quinoa]